MNKNNKIIKYSLISLISLFALFFIIGIINEMRVDTYTSEDLFPSNASKWVLDDETTKEKTISVNIITKGDSVIDGANQVYNVPYKDIITIFSIDGFYDGFAFEEQFSENEKVLMRISEEMIPGDEIIEGFIVEKINDYETKNISAFIFVDSDWKEALPNTKIFWGSNYQYYTTYEFNEISDGIYMFEIYDDPNRHFDDFSISLGGIAVGNLEKENIINNNIDGRTFMRLYS